MRILVCDDHPLSRQGLKSILLADKDVASVGEAGSVPELMDLVRSQPWDAVVLDINLPGRSGLEGLRQIKLERPRLPVLVVSFHDAEQYAVRTLRAGASGYLTKGVLPTELVKAVRVVAGGRKYVTSDVAERLARDLERPSDRPPHETLTDREFQILCLLGSGRTVSEIARTLALSVKTVSTHRVNTLRKLGLKSNLELIRYVIQHGLDT